MPQFPVRKCTLEVKRGLSEGTIEKGERVIPRPWFERVGLTVVGFFLWAGKETRRRCCAKMRAQHASALRHVPLFPILSAPTISGPLMRPPVPTPPSLTAPLSIPC